MSTVVPAMFGKYRILDQLGEGGMGAVYRAEDTVLLRHVAVKVMTETIARQDTLRERFLREARAAGSLQHPNIVTVYDFGEVDGHLFIAMELVDGEDLERLLAREAPPTLDAKLAIVGDLLAGLAYAHRHGVVHRDIKPPNVQVTSDGRVKLMDFGIAYVGASDLTGTGLAIGTPSYMAPEQVTGGAVTAAADLFAVGVVLYELVSGVRPFSGPSLHSILYKIVSEEPPALSTLVPGVPPALVQVVARALQKEPAARYESAQAMAQDLAAVRASLSGAPWDAAASRGPSSDGTPIPSGPWTRAIDAAAATPANPPLTIAPARASASNTGPTTTDQLTGGQPVTGRGSGGASSRARWPIAGVAACALAAIGVWAARREVPGSVAPPVGLAGPAPAVASAAASTPAVDHVPGTNSVVSSGAAPIATRPATLAPPLPSAPPRTEVTRATSSVVPTATARGAVPGTAARPLAGASAPAPAPGTSRPSADAASAPIERATVAAAPASAPAASEAAVPPPSAANTAAEIGDAARAYAHAIESRDLTAVRRAYPGVTDAQERGFRQFFEAARNLHVTFAVSGVEVSGSTADARLSGTYEYTTTDGQRQRQPVDFAATLRREAGAWHLVAVR